MKRWLFPAPLLCAFVLAAQPVHGAEFGDAKLGRVLAETWCQNCHLINGETSARTQSDAPPFVEIAKTLDENRAEQLRIWLTDPHGAMPNLSLTRDEIADVLAYIKSLATAD